MSIQPYNLLNPIHHQWEVLEKKLKTTSCNEIKDNKAAFQIRTYLTNVI